MKPMLAEDWDEATVRFPVMVQPKIDGVRALNLFGTLTGRSLKTFKNKHVTGLFSHSMFLGFDGEMAAESETHPDLCRLTTSALGTIEGQPYVLWHLFDYVTQETRSLPYWQRLDRLKERVNDINYRAPHLGQHLRIIPRVECGRLATLQTYYNECMEKGYEGAIIRDPVGVHKAGRSTVREGGLLRIKMFADAEGVVKRIVEGETNLNEATINALGHTERSTHQANMVSNGLVGTLIVELVADLHVGDKVFPKGTEVTVSAGRLTSEERAFYLLHPAEIVGKLAKFQYFPHGVKDKLRFATFQSLRMKEDML